MMRVARLCFVLTLIAILAGCAGGQNTGRMPTMGPAIESIIIGSTTWSTAAVAIRTDEPGIGQITLISDDDSYAQRRTFETTREGGRFAIVEFDVLQPREKYILYDIRGEIGSFRTMPRPGERVPMRFAVGSCFNFKSDEITEYAGGEKNVVANHQVWKRLNKQKKLDAFFMIGDRFYLPGKYSDYDGMTDEQVLELFREYYDGMISVPGVEERFSTVPVYCIWDDHDFGPNDSGGNFAFKDIALIALGESFANPPMGEPDNPGCYFRATFGAVDAFFLDDRYYRDCGGGENCNPKKRQLSDGTYTSDPPLDHMLGRQQFEWLKRGLASSTAPVKLVIDGNQMLSNIHKYEHWGLFQEREEFFDWLNQEKIPGIVFIAGDRHTGEIGVIHRGVPYPLYELTASGMGVNVYGADEDTPESPYDTIGPVADVHHFGLIEYDPSGSGSVTLSLVSRTGKTINKVKIPLTELQAN
ncbi:alkaline phosphatase family protein [bacterium]|nr:alkaline phosphatase family protein [bacterium]